MTNKLQMTPSYTVYDY